ncbi:MvaI/BcnI family restriction endonuclease [Vibrio maritimus]
MPSQSSPLPSLKRFKQRVKTLKKELDISHSKALDQLSQEFGFANWEECNKHYADEEVRQLELPLPSLRFVADEDVSMSQEDYQVYDSERTEAFSLDCKQMIQQNKKELAKLGVEYSVFEPTATGLKKSIIDATHPVRLHFEQENYHVYREQQQEPGHKVMTDAFLVTPSKVISSTARLYRPNTKKGDPRMWFSKLKEIAEPNELVAIIIDNNTPYLLNISRLDLALLIGKGDNEVAAFFQRYTSVRGEVSTELLEKLKILAQKPMKALRTGDTALGYTLEFHLGISANSSKKPDYKGIEIKTGRGKKTRTTIFAQVADWSISPCKRSVDILNRYGYERGEDFRLYCTVSTLKQNSQGLNFKYNQEQDYLEEWYKDEELAAVWPGELLRTRLREKHAETFWVQANSEFVDGVEYFDLLSVTHTKSPISSQFLPLIESGVITMDHLIKRDGSNNKVTEKGPLFKIDKKNLDLLFPTPVLYSLKEAT